MKPLHACGALPALGCIEMAQCSRWCRRDPLADRYPRRLVPCVRRGGAPRPGALRPDNRYETPRTRRQTGGDAGLVSLWCTTTHRRVKRRTGSVHQGKHRSARLKDPFRPGDCSAPGSAWVCAVAGPIRLERLPPISDWGKSDSKSVR